LGGRPRGFGPCAGAAARAGAAAVGAVAPPRFPSADAGPRLRAGGRASTAAVPGSALPPALSLSLLLPLSAPPPSSAAPPAPTTAAASASRTNLCSSRPSPSSAASTGSRVPSAPRYAPLSKLMAFVVSTPCRVSTAKSRTRAASSPVSYVPRYTDLVRVSRIQDVQVRKVFVRACECTWGCEVAR
jgi:hypothetical protein